jgi:hypothetical protein
MAYVDIAGLKNTFEHSEEFNDNYWTKNECTITANATTAPDGSLTAFKLTESATANKGHNISKTVGGSGSTNGNSYSVYVKADTRTKFIVGLGFNADSLTTNAKFDLTAETVISTGNAFGYPKIFGQIVKQDNGWYRCILQVSTGGGAFNPNYYIGSIDDTNDNTPSTGSGSIFIWGAMWQKEHETVVNGTNAGRYVYSGNSSGVEGSLWQYENSATAANTYPDSADGANSTVSGGIRTHTRPGTSAVTKTYLRTRKKGTTVERGELSHTYLHGA